MFNLIGGVLYQSGTIWGDLSYTVFDSPQPLGENFVPGETRILDFSRTDYTSEGAAVGPGHSKYTITTSASPETITVPAGSYSVYTVILKDEYLAASGESGTNVYEYALAMDVGIVRMKITYNDGSTYTFNLDGTSLPPLSAEYFPLHTESHQFVEWNSGISGTLAYTAVSLPEMNLSLLFQEQIMNGQTMEGNLFSYAAGRLYQYGNLWRNVAWSIFDGPQPLGELFVPGETCTLGFTRTDYSEATGEVVLVGAGSCFYTVTTSDAPSSVTVPAGTYSAYHITFRDDFVTGEGKRGVTDIQYWLAKDIGIVRSLVTDSENGQVYDFRLNVAP